MNKRTILTIAAPLLLLTACGVVTVRIEQPSVANPTAAALAAENAQMATQITTCRATIEAREATLLLTTEPTSTPFATATPTADPGACALSATFVADVTVPDNTEFPPGTPFTKVWRIGNSGTCEWEAGTQLAFLSGDPLDGPAAVPVESIAPGLNTDVSVNLTSPTTPGSYSGQWRLQSPDGIRFGSVVFVKIVVPALTTAAPPPTEPSPTPLPKPPHPGWTTYTTDDGLGSNYANDVVAAPNGTVWAGTYQGGVSSFNGETWTTYSDGGLPCNDVNGIAIAPDGIVWAGTSCGISYFDGRTWAAYHDLNDVDRRVLSIDVAPDGTVWFGTLSGSVGRISVYDHTFTEYFIKDGLAASPLNAIAATPDGTVWAGGHKGAFRLDGTTWTQADALVYYRVYDIAVASDDEVWFATDTDGGAFRFFRYSGGEEWGSMGLSDKDVTTIAVAPDGAIWAGRSDGIFGPFGEWWENHATEDGLASNNVTSIAVAPDGKVWVGTDAGVSCYVPLETAR